MRLKITKTNSATNYYIIKDVKNNGKRTTVIHERLGTEKEILERSNGEDISVWIKKYLNDLNSKKDQLPVLIKKYPLNQINKNEQNSFNCGYFFLEKIYYDLGLNQICESIKKKYSFKYDLNNILSRLLYARIIFPSSKLATYNLSKNFLEQPNFELQHIYRALEVMSKENEFIQSELYKNSLKKSKRNTGILYYDCTNYFFEIENEDELRKYGPSKEHKPNPIVQMGLFMDGDGIPLAFNITSGNTNEQGTLTPTEEKILKDFELSKFIVCTDAGLASNDNRKFNNIDERAFITTQSIKKLKKHLKEWALSPDNWYLSDSKKKYNIKEIENKLKNTIDETEKQKLLNMIFYKERWIKENDLEQKLIVTFSFKYQHYQRHIRENQLDRAKKAMENKNFKLDKKRQTDFKRFIKKTSVTKEGEMAEKEILTINEKMVLEEEKYDGFYGVCTNLDDEAKEIIKVNKRRWEIEESFRIMKSEFKARPVYLSREDRIIAHFTTCFLSLVLHRYLEKRLKEKYTATEIIETLRNMNLTKINSEGYIPSYKRTDLTDLLHDTFKFRTDYEIIENKNIKKILKKLKK